MNVIELLSFEVTVLSAANLQALNAKNLLPSQFEQMYFLHTFMST